MSGYVGKLQIGNNENDRIAFGDVLYGICRTAENTAVKVLENGVQVGQTIINDFPAGFQQLMDGIQVRIKFVNGNSVTSGAKLKILNTSELPIEGDCRCNQGEVIVFTFEENVGGTSCWRVTGGGISASIQNYVSNAISQMTGTVDSMVFKGTLGASGTIATVPDGSSGKTYKAGYTYKIITAGTYAGNVCEVGDLLIAIADSTSGQSAVNNAHWTVVQTNIDGAVTGPASSTANHIAIFNDTSGKVIQDSGLTIETSVPSNAVFTDTNTSYKYTISAPTANAYNGTTTYDSSNATSTALVSVSGGVLRLEEGITFTTAAAVTSATLTESSAAGPSLTPSSGT